MKKYLLLTTLSIAIATPAIAEEFDSLGVGTAQCSKLTAMYRDAAPGISIQILDAMLGSWSGGFMTATNFARFIAHDDTKNLAGVTLEQQIIGIRRYCKQNPNEEVWIGVAEMFKSLPSSLGATVQHDGDK